MPAGPIPRGCVVRDFGDRGLLVEPVVPSAGRDFPTEWVLGTAGTLARAFPGVTVVPGLASVLLSVVDPVLRPRLEDVEAALARPGGAEDPSAEDSRAEDPSAGDPSGAGARVHEIPVSYDGPDLSGVARSLGVPIVELVARHAAARWIVAAVGFSPGFGYLTCDDPLFADVPRRADPRPKVPPGSVALAAGMCAVYPSASPGGWQLIGRTAATLLDLSLDPPALLSVGDRVTFRAVGGIPAPGPGADTAGSAVQALEARRQPSVPGFEVAAVAGIALFQDRGRRHTASGVPGSGAFDRAAHAAAIALVAGDPDDATIEVVGRLDLVVRRATTCALTGAGSIEVDGRPAPGWMALDVPAGALVRVTGHGPAYLAVAGGFRVAPVLGSRSTCLLGPVGPPPLRAGDTVPVRVGATSRTAGDFVQPGEERGPLHAVPGPHLSALPARATVVATSRIGVRLRPSGRSSAARDPAATLPSLGVLPGTLQVLPSGDWIALGPDSGTMGGYPVVGVLVAADVDRLAHLRAGDRIGIVPVVAAATPPREGPRVVRVAHLLS